MEVITKKHLEDFTRKLLESDKTINDELLAKICEGKTYVTPDMFGANGDYITDTEAFKKAMETGLPILLLNKEYYVNSLGLKDVVIEGISSDSTIVVKKLLVTRSNVLLRNLTLKMPEDKTSDALITTMKSANNITLEKVIFTGSVNIPVNTITGYEFIKFTNQNDAGYSSDDVKNSGFYIRNCKFYESNSTTICGYGDQDDVVIDGCEFFEKTSETNSIMIFNTRYWKNLSITNNIFHKYTRMPIEVADVDALKITGNTFMEDVSETNTSGSNRFYYSMSLPGCSNIEITNNIGINCSGIELGTNKMKNEEQTEVTSRNINISNNNFTFKYGGIVINGGNGNIYDIRISDNYLKHFNPPHKSLGYTLGEILETIHDLSITGNTIVDCGIISLGDINNVFSNNIIIRTKKICKPLLEIHGNSTIVKNNSFMVRDISEDEIPAKGDRPYCIYVRHENLIDLKILDNVILGGNYTTGFIGTWDDKTIFDNAETIIIQGNKMRGCYQDTINKSIFLPKKIKFFDNTIDDNVSGVFPPSAEITLTHNNKSYQTVSDMKQDLSLKIGQVCETLGHETVNDGRNAKYVINQSYAEKDIYEELDNGLYAILTETNSVLVSEENQVLTHGVYDKIILTGEMTDLNLVNTKTDIMYTIMNSTETQKNIQIENVEYVCKPKTTETYMRSSQNSSIYTTMDVK